MMPKSLVDFDFQTYDFSKHGVIEASAGSGKTTAIVNLVTRLIQEKICAEKDILVVTFTNNATQELEHRIKHKLSNLGLSPFLIKENDSISIKSIHSFLYHMTHLKPGILEQEGISFDKRVVTESKKLLYSYLKGDLLEDKPFTKETLSSFLYYADLEYQFFNEKTLFKEDDGSYKNKKADLVTLVKRYDYTMFKEEGLKESALFPFLLTREDVDNIKKQILSFKPQVSTIVCDPDWKDLKKNVITLSIKQWHNNLFTPIERIEELFGNEYINVEDVIEVVIMLKNRLKDIEKHLSGTGITKKKKEYFEPFLSQIESLIVAFIRLVEPLVYQVQLALIKDLALRLYKGQGLLNVKTQEDAIHYINQYHYQFKDYPLTDFRFIFIDECQDTSQLEWETLKMIFDRSQAKITLIGDPKQSIYQFKGGDVNAYLKACEELLANGGIRYTLSSNYRSHPQLLSILNTLFSHPLFFSKEQYGKDSIEYLKAVAGKTPEHFSDRYKVGSHFTILKKQDKEQKNDKEWLQSVIKDYVNRIIQIKSKDPKARIGILGSRGQDLNEMYLHLVKDGVHSYQYKKRELFNSKIADDIFVLLFALSQDANDADRDLLFHTPFFIGYGSFIEKENALRKLSQMVEYKRWYDLCQVILFELPLLDAINFEDFSTYKQILDTLFSHAQNRSLSLEHLINRLLTLKEKENNSHDDNYYEYDILPDKDPVLLMTIHVSKGLEFDYVFLLLNQKTDQSAFMIIPQKGEASQVILGSPSQNLKEQWLKNLYQEQANLYYVGFTRSKYALVVSSINSNELFFEPFLTTLLNDGAVDESDPTMNPTAFPTQKIDYVKEGGSKVRTLPTTIDLMGLYGALSLNWHRYYQYSFSSLKRLSEEKQEESHHTVLLLEEYENSVSLNKKEENPYHQLAKGTETGTIFHHLIENWVSYLLHTKLGQEHSVKNYVQQALLKENDNTKALFTMMLIDLFKIQLPLQEKMIGQILEVETNYCIEMTIDTKSSLKGLGLKAIVDIIWVNEQGQFYFLDWKTNALPSYDPLYLDKVVEKNYAYQWKIYLVSLVSFLKQNLENFDYEKHIGGFYYLFVRGVNEESQGILFQKAPPFNEYQLIEQDVLELINKATQ